MALPVENSVRTTCRADKSVDWINSRGGKRSNPGPEGPRRPGNLQTGNVLHFDLLDAAYFALKFRQRPAPRDIFYLRYMLGVVARDHSAEEIREFFETYIAIRHPERIERLKKRGILVEIRSPSNLLKKLLKTPSTIEA